MIYIVHDDTFGVSICKNADDAHNEVKKRFDSIRKAYGWQYAANYRIFDVSCTPLAGIVARILSFVALILALVSLITAIYAAIP